jgi:hypothetical protein
MCVISMVMDYYRPKFPQEPIKPLSPAQIIEFQELVDNIKKAAEAAKVVDDLTGQPDCVDPEKAQLLKRVETLEKELKKLKSKKAQKK